MPILHVHSPRTSVYYSDGANRPKPSELLAQLAEKGASLEVCPPGFSGIITPHCWKSTIGAIGCMLLEVDETGKAAVIDRSGMHSNLGARIIARRTTKALSWHNIHIPDDCEALALAFSDSTRRDAPIQVGGMVICLTAEKVEDFRRLHAQAAVAQMPESW